MIFKYEETQLEEGFYIVKITNMHDQSPEITIGKYNDTSEWEWIGYDYDYVQYSYKLPHKIEVLQKIDIPVLEKTE